MKPRLFACLGVLSALAPAQPLPGDWILSTGTSTTGGLYSVTPGGTVLTTIVTLPIPGNFNCVTMERNNVDLVTARSITVSPSPIMTVSPFGVVATVATSSASVTAMDVDQDGRSLISCGYQPGGGIYFVGALDLPTGAITTLASFLNAPNGLTLDHDTGDYIPVLFTEGSVLRVQRGTVFVTTLVTTLGSLSGADFEPRTGSFVVTRFSPSPGVIRVGPTGVVTTIAAITGSANGVRWTTRPGTCSSATRRGPSCS